MQPNAFCLVREPLFLQRFPSSNSFLQPGLLIFFRKPFLSATSSVHCREQKIGSSNPISSSPLFRVHKWPAVSEQNIIFPTPAPKRPAMDKRWHFASPNPAVLAAGEKSIQRYMLDLHGCLDERGPLPVIPLSHGDPASAPTFRTAPEAVEAVAAALRSGEFNGYPSVATNLAARRSVTHPPILVSLLLIFLAGTSVRISLFPLWLVDG
jgi:hypothetical protein